MYRRFAASLLVTLVLAALAALAIPAAAGAVSLHPAPANTAGAWWAELVSQVRSLFEPAATVRADAEPRPAGARRDHRLVPTCSSGMDPDGRCRTEARPRGTRWGHGLNPTCSGAMDPDGHCRPEARPRGARWGHGLNPTCSGGMDPNGHCY